MTPIYEVDFPALSVEEKKKFVYNLDSQTEADFAAYPFEINLLAQALIFTRWWNSYKHMAPKEPTPEILETALELLWDFQEGQCGPKSFARFQKSFTDSALEILTGDDSGLNEDSESDAFSQKYFTPWNASSYNVFLSNLSIVIEEAVNRETTWYPVMDLLYGDIGDTMIEFFETVYQAPNNIYHPSDCDRRDGEVYSTPTFCRVIALLQQDMRAALEGTPLPELRARYRNEYLFSPEVSAKISDYR